MKKKNLSLVLLLTVALVLTAVLATGCVRKKAFGKGSIKEFSYEADNFSEIEIKDIYLKNGGNSFGPKVNVLPSAEKKITILMDENFENEIKVRKEGNKKIIQGNKLHTLMTERLEICLYGYVLSDVDLSGACEATVSSLCVDKNNLDVELSGACTLTLDAYDGANLHCELSGASILVVGNCKVANVELDLSGASEVSFSNLVTTSLDLDLGGASRIDLLLGSTNTFSGEVSGASTVRAKTFELETGEVNLSGASRMNVKVNKSLTGEASGASNLFYSGEGAVNVKVSGGSSVEKVK